MKAKGANKIFARAVVGLLLAVLVTFVACSQDNMSPYEFRENMSPKEIRELLLGANSFAVQTEDCDYRLLKTEGFSLYEFGEYEVYFIKGNSVCHIVVDDEGERCETLPLDDAYYEMVEEVFYEYVEHVSATYGLSSSTDAQLDITVTKGEAQVKTTWRKSAGEIVIVTCRLFGVNNTNVYVPEQFEHLYNSFE